MDDPVLAPTRDESDPYPGFLRTKFHIPLLRSTHVARPRLIAQLEQALDHKVTVISAPPGFGKSTLLAGWIATRNPQVAWVSLDVGDNDPMRFWSYVVMTLDGLRAGMAETILPLLQSPQAPSLEAALTLVINQLTALEYPVFLILDDYHVIDAPSIHHALTFLIALLPPQMHVVIATRTDPPIPFSHWRAKGELIELRAANLRFTLDEAEAFLNHVMKLGLSAEDIAALDARTEGWIVGLQLAALSLQDRPDVDSFIEAFTGSHRFVVDYLVEEVLNRQSDSIQIFLLQTSILN